MTYYLDANIFIYASNPDDPNFETCSSILKRVGLREIKAVTSTETIQEIIFYSQKFKNVKAGIAIASGALKIAHQILSIDLNVTHRYLDLVALYPNIDSRDNLHTATCLVNNIDTIVSADKSLDKIKEIKRVDPKIFIP
ncbi:MAG: type II toxin-antitoxin system VapC family toxin [Candidatus Woykebacteria bacterium]